MNHLAVVLAVLAVASARNADVRIIGGKPTAIEKYPYQVALDTVGEGFSCGGSLVSIQHVLTAAHCVLGKVPQNISVRVGATYRRSGGIRIGVQNFTANKDYDSYFKDYDIAVIKLMKPVMISPSVRPISLVPVKDKRFAGEMVTATGWGRTAYDGKDNPDCILQVVRLPVVDNYRCGLTHLTTITERCFCAGGNSHQGMYFGDSGGPAINEKGQLVGLTSWGRSDNLTGRPSVFVDLTNLAIRKFVIENIK